MDIQDQVKNLASKGRYGDTMLVHMNPAEVQYMHENSPTGLTINPDTGQPEAFLPLLGSLIGGYMGAGTMVGAAAGAGIGSFLGGMAQGDEFGTAVAGGLMSYGLGSLFTGAQDAATGLTEAQRAVMEGGGTAAEMAKIAPPIAQAGGSTVGQPMAGNTMAEMFPNSGRSIMDAGGQMGWGNLGSAAIDNAGYGTAAAALGAASGGLDNLTGPAPVFEAPKKTPYAARAPKTSGVMRKFNPEPEGFQAGIDGEHNYLTPNSTFQGFAEGGYVRPPTGYNPGFDGEFNYGFSNTNDYNNSISPTPFNDKKLYTAQDILDAEAAAAAAAAPAPTAPQVTQQIQADGGGNAPGNYGEYDAQNPGQSFNNDSFAAYSAGYEGNYSDGYGVDPGWSGGEATASEAEAAGAAQGGIVSLRGFAGGGYLRPPSGYNAGTQGEWNYGFSSPNSFDGTANPAGFNETTQYTAQGILDAEAAAVQSALTPPAPSATQVLQQASGGQMDGVDPTAGMSFDSDGQWSGGGPGDTSPSTPDAAPSVPDGFSSNIAEGGLLTEDGAITGDLANEVGQNPIVMGAVAAIMGNHPEPQAAIQAFVQTYGEEAFMTLREGVIQEATAEDRGNSGLGGMINGPGTGTSDDIPGQIMKDGAPVEDIKVSDGEYILPKATVDAVGPQALDDLRAATNPDHMA